MTTDTLSPLVSILINNYNYGDFLAEAIASSLNQSYPCVEVIVVDDGSTDRSMQVIESYGDQIISILKVNGGQASAFNQGFAASHGEIICFLDADDLFTLNKIEKVVKIFHDHPESEWCFNELLLFEGEIPISPVLSKLKPDLSGVYDVRESFKKGKLKGKLPFKGTATSGLSFRRSLLEKLLPMPEEIRITSDDYLKYAALGLASGYILLDEISLQRIHSNNAYTLRKDKHSLKSKIEILTAFWLKTNFPQFSRFTNNIFAIGYSFYIPKQNDNDDLSFQLLVQKYLSSINIFERLEIEIRKLFYQLKSIVNPFPQV